MASTRKSPRHLIARGVRTHNLQNVNFRVPIGKLTVVTGVSGSGKSSLALDTLYAEGERRYVESLSTYARQFLERLARPDADYISHIPPAVAIQHRNDVKNARSTVGTATEIHDYMRLIFARIGRAHCALCGGPVRRVAPTAARETLREMASPDAHARIIAPMRLWENETPRELVARARSRGAVRALTTKGMARLDEAKPELLVRSGELQAVVDRVSVARSPASRVAEAVAAAYQLAGRAIAQCDDGTHLTFSENFGCLVCGVLRAEPTPLLFSFNSPRGACPRCEGFGRVPMLDMDRVVPDPMLSLADGAIGIWQRPAYRDILPYFRNFAKRHHIPWRTPYRKLSAAQRRRIMTGDDDFPGIDGFFEWLKRKRYKVHVRVFLARHRKFDRCPVCMGKRIVPEALAVEVGGRNIADLAALPIPELRVFLESLDLARAEKGIAGEIVADVVSRLRFLEDVGLGYLSLARQTRTLSAGESQRIRLAAALGSSLAGVLYILDEPTVGLHARDIDRLIATLKRLVAKSNTVLAIEHDPRVIRAAEHVIDLGPGGGERGGRVLFQGAPEKLARKNTPTGRALAAPPSPAIARRTRRAAGHVTIRKARTHNLKNITVSIPLGRFVCVTGVSGSGKSSLIVDTFYAACRRAEGYSGFDEPGLAAVEGTEAFSEIVLVDAKPLARSRRSNIVTHVGAYTHIRTALSRASGGRVGPGRFSFNVAGGRCPKCKGLGTLDVDMVFMADVTIMCDECQGKRFLPKVLDVSLRGRNILDILDMTADEAHDFFAGNKPILNALAPLRDIGLGYIRLGQSTDTLSGGEAARLKLARYLRSRERSERRLFLFDEPTTGLHPADIELFLGVARKLISQGHSFVVIEHNPGVIAQADYIIDLGPEGGNAGGRVVGRGAVAAIARKDTPTGRALREYLGSRPDTRQSPRK